MTPTLYDRLRALPECSPEELRAAYRQRARELHPDVTGQADVGDAMAKLNEAWRVLSDPAQRASYDATIVVGTSVAESSDGRPAASGFSAPPSDLLRRPGPTSAENRYSRRAAWVAGIQAQIVRISRLAGRSATQTLLIRSNRAPRSTYERLVDAIVVSLSIDTEARVRAARAAGTAPLDLGVAATLVGLRTLADKLRRQASLGVDDDLVMTAELVDRMWDILAHELAKPLADSLGGNPDCATKLRA